MYCIMGFFFSSKSKGHDSGYSCIQKRVQYKMSHPALDLWVKTITVPTTARVRYVCKEVEGVKEELATYLIRYTR